ncbi:hypothetical protein [Cytobacillus purgationiresistens]|uniref:Methyl-accepting chemotaxis protein n=1 Tax=Cytobacillus purgationiresistens TaxID=863449 RepID=A0ABU0AB22_9BACI|nr:hypothetical protein [Cytobacillus purgationiresistens]MDQ0268452.1 methyl-accepting chemotaxis protein [Cytobacillus purgationiresistens]
MDKNDDMKPTLYLNEPDEVNQPVYRLNYLYELLQKQDAFNHELTVNYHRINHQISDSFKHLRQIVNQASSLHQRQYETVNNRMHLQDELMDDLLLSVKEHELNNQAIFNRITALENSSEEMVNILEQESLMKKEILQQMNFQDAAAQEITRKLGRVEDSSESITLHLQEQENASRTILSKMDAQEVYHQTVMERLDEQEALSQKISRQLEHLKSVVFERAAFLGEHIKTIAKPVTSFFVHQEEKQKKKEK